MMGEQKRKRGSNLTSSRFGSYESIFDPLYKAKYEISLAMTEDHIIPRVPRNAKPPPRFSHGERDIPLSNEWRLRRKRPKLIPTDNHQIATQTVNVIIPRYKINYDSDDSPLTDLEDLGDEVDNLRSESPPDDVQSPVRETVSEDHKRTTLKETSQEHGCDVCAKEILDLRQQVQQLERRKRQTTKTLEEEVDTLRQQNKDLKEALLRNDSRNARSSHRNTSDAKTSLNQLREKNEEIKRLRRRLSNTLDFIELTRPVSEWDAFVASTGFINKEMQILNNYIAYAADSLSNIKIQNIQTQKNKVLSQGLIQLIGLTITDTCLVSADPVSAFRALIFGFIQERIFQAPGIWRDLHFGGLMLRQYQQMLETRISADVLEKYHRAAIRLTLTKSREFKETFVREHAEELQSNLIDLFAPLISTVDVDSQLKRQLTTLFCHAIQLRAACYPGNGTRYQIIQYKPGYVYDSQLMKAEDEVGLAIHVPEDGQLRRIKVCVHGLMKAHSIQETASGIDQIRELSHPFVPEAGSDGTIISEKATVILE